MRSSLMCIMSIIATGCATTEVSGVPADVVINRLKASLSNVAPLDVSYTAEKGCQPSGSYKIVAVPTKASVQLKTVLTDANTVGIGGKFGTPIVATPSLSSVATSVKTTQMNMNFCVMPESLRGVTDLAPGSDCLWTLADPTKSYAHTLWPTKTKSITLDPKNSPKHNMLVSIAAKNQPTDADLAEALESAVGGLIYSSHIGSCLLPQDMNVQVAFQIVAQTDTGLKLDFVIVNLQDTLSRKRDYTNTIDVTFSLKKGSTSTLY